MRYKTITVSSGVELHYFPNWVDNSDAAFLEAEKLSFSDEVVTMYKKANVIRRRTVDYGPHYLYNKTAKASIAWESPALAFREKLERQFGVEFGQCACNEFIDHEAYIGPHHDKGLTQGNEKREPLWIVSISLGAMRRMVLTPPGAKLKGVPITVAGLMKVPGSVMVELEPGSLIVFSNAFNKTWKHSIPKDYKDIVTGKRISLTYRHYGFPKSKYEARAHKGAVAVFAEGKPIVENLPSMKAAHEQTKKLEAASSLLLAQGETHER